MNRLYAVPDIHGRSDLLEKGLAFLKDQRGLDLSKDTVVFLGDMIDRGWNSKGVIDQIKDLKEKHPNNVIVLRGNHEDMALDHLMRGAPPDLWYYNGGYEAQCSYPMMRMTEDHVRFLACLPYHHEQDGFFFSHAPVPRQNSRKGAFGEYSVSELTWTYMGPECDKRGALFDVHEGPLAQKGLNPEKHLIGVCGHIHRGKSVTEVRIFPNYRMLDVGCGCWEEAPLVIHECHSNETVYIR